MIATDAKLILTTFFDKLGSASGSTLALDYDGTLAPFRADRFSAVPYPGVAERLRGILASARTRVILVSGRPSEEVRDLLGIAPAPEIWGQHGAQRLHPDGRSELMPLNASDRRALDDAAAWIHSEGLESQAEFKSTSAAVHWRGLPQDQIAALDARVHQAFVAIAQNSSLSILRFDGGIELRPGAINKGTALRAILAETAPGSPLAYLGDDLTDEDAFRVLRGTGALTALVRSEFRPTGAEIWLRPPEELLHFLSAWLERTGDAR